MRRHQFLKSCPVRVRERVMEIDPEAALVRVRGLARADEGLVQEAALRGCVVKVGGAEDGNVLECGGDAQGEGEVGCGEGEDGDGERGG
ncbi:hypothetical protein BGZ74_002702 [Mortierella antarctica]|nr:hypothetical protein BGZ74_002702 [Mortierella antarctica]